MAFSRARNRLTQISPGRRASYREGVSYGALSFGAVAVLALISSVANSRMYGIAAIGEYALAMGTVNVVRFTSTTKERPALVRELTQLEPRHPRVTGLFVATLSFSFVLTLVAGVIGLVVTQLLLTGPISQPTLLLPIAVNVAGYVFLGNTGENVEVIMNGFRAGRETFWARMSTAITFLAVSVYFGLRHGDVWGLIGAQVASMGVGLVHRVWLVRPFMRFTATKAILRDGFKTLPGLIKFGIKIYPGAIADDTANESGTYVVGSFGTIADIGAYGRALMLVKQLLVFNARVNAVLFPTLIERRAQGDDEGYCRVLVDSLRYTAVALALPAVACGGAAEGVMHVFGAGFGRAGDALALLLLVPPLSALSQNQRVALYSLDKAWLGSVAGLLRFGVTIVLSIVLTWRMGATGAALGLVFGFFFDLAFSLRVVARNVTTPLRALSPPREWIVLVAAYAGGYVIGKLVYGALGYPLGVAAGGVCSTLVFCVVLLAAVNERDRMRYREVRQMLTRRRARRRAQPAVAVAGGVRIRRWATS